MLTKNDLEVNLARIHEWTRSADQKVSIFLAFQGVVLTLLFTNIFSLVVDNLKNLPCKTLSIILIISGITLAGYSVYKSISAIIPQLNKDKKRKSITYFGDIAKFNYQDFRKEIKEINIDKYEIELIEQIYTSSKIVALKHSQLRDAIFSFFCGMALLILSFIFLKI